MGMNGIGDMNVREARAKLVPGSLKFGDSDQIAAVRLLELYEEALGYGASIMWTCDECDGDGVTDCFHCNQEMNCNFCAGTGKAKRELTDTMNALQLQGYIADAREYVLAA